MEPYEYIEAVGVVSTGCRNCNDLRREIARALNDRGIIVQFTEVVYEDGPDVAMDACVKFGLDDMPSYNIADVIFRSGFSEDDVNAAVKAVRGG